MSYDRGFQRIRCAYSPHFYYLMCLAYKITTFFTQIAHSHAQFCILSQREPTHESTSQQVNRSTSAAGCKSDWSRIWVCLGLLWVRSVCYRGAKHRFNPLKSDYCQRISQRIYKNLRWERMKEASVILVAFTACIIRDFAFLTLISGLLIFAAICFDDIPIIDKDITCFSNSENFSIGIFNHLLDRVLCCQHSPVTPLNIFSSFLSQLHIYNLNNS